MSIDYHASEIAPYTNEIVRQMFVATADQNYVLARVAYFSEFDVDFFWLSAHALEKYLKAILLLNGRSAKRYGHNIVSLYDDARKLNPRPDFGPLVCPDVDNLQIKNLLWRNCSVAEFVVRLETYGNADNRYLTHGYSVGLEDLMKVDQLIWSVRRHCRPFFDKFDLGDGVDEIDQVEVLKNAPERWVVDASLPLERLLNGEYHDESRSQFLRLNIPFARNVDYLDRQVMSALRLAAKESPLLRDFELLQESTASSETKTAAANVLRWALTNINLGQEVKRKITDALRGYDKSI